MKECIDGNSSTATMPSKKVHHPMWGSNFGNVRQRTDRLRRVNIPHDPQIKSLMLYRLTAQGISTCLQPAQLCLR